jgi:glycosyltransferase involved in cell wall biosynthesis
MKKNVLIFISHYLPGYKIGGPLNSIIGITENLNQYFRFHIISSDRDMGDSEPFKEIETNTWHKLSNIKVKYLKAGINYYFNVYKDLSKNQYDTIYLNSFFDFKFSIFIVLLFRLKLSNCNKIVLAPRGELFPVSLSFGKIKKQVFLLISKFFNLHGVVTWHSTNIKESQTIINLFKNAEIKMVEVLANNESYLIPEKSKNSENKYLRIIYLSRISKDKNLIYTFKTLMKVRSKVQFHIYGPIEDNYIWDECLDKIKELPKNITVKYMGGVRKEDVIRTFSKYDLFFFPTYNENYGHVINESLSVGTSVLISNNTPWRELDSNGLGWDFSLEENDLFVDVIEDFSKLSSDGKYQKRKDVLKNYKIYTKKENLINDYIKLFNGE